MWGISPFDQIQCRIDFKQKRYDKNPWTPATKNGSIIFPGNIGVFNWGSVSIDPEQQILIASPIRLAYLYNLIERSPKLPMIDYSRKKVHRTGMRIFKVATQLKLINLDHL